MNAPKPVSYAVIDANSNEWLFEDKSYAVCVRWKVKCKSETTLVGVIEIKEAK